MAMGGRASLNCSAQLPRMLHLQSYFSLLQVGTK